MSGFRIVMCIFLFYLMLITLLEIHKNITYYKYSTIEEDKIDYLLNIIFNILTELCFIGLAIFIQFNN